MTSRPSSANFPSPERAATSAQTHPSNGGWIVAVWKARGSMRLYVKARDIRTGPFQKVVCPVIPEDHWAAASDLSSRIARSGSSRLQVRAWKQESQKN